MRKLKKVTVVMICISIFYIVLSSVLPSASLSFRTWADVLGQGILLLLTPLLMVVIFVAWIQRRERMHAVLRVSFQWQQQGDICCGHIWQGCLFFLAYTRSG